jgi:hypothetical protein
MFGFPKTHRIITEFREWAGNTCSASVSDHTHTFTPAANLKFMPVFKDVAQKTIQLRNRTTARILVVSHV